jgi:hypothetical protein
MRRYIVLLLITGIVWAQTDFDKLVLKNGTTYLGEYSKIEGDRVYFKHQDALAFQPVPVELIKQLQLKDGRFIIAPKLKIKAKNQDKLILKSGATYFGEFSTIDGDNVYFKPKGASDFQSIPIKQIQTLELSYGPFIIAPGLKIEAKYQNKFTNKKKFFTPTPINLVGCLIFTIIAGGLIFLVLASSIRLDFPQAPGPY